VARPYDSPEVKAQANKLAKKREKRAKKMFKNGQQSLFKRLMLRVTDKLGSFFR
jgi:hypothetical protein